LRRQGYLEKVSRTGRQHVKAWSNDLAKSGKALGSAYKEARPALFAASVALTPLCIAVATEESIMAYKAEEGSQTQKAHEAASEAAAFVGIASTGITAGIFTEWAVNDLTPQVFDLYKSVLKMVENILPEDLDLGVV